MLFKRFYDDKLAQASYLIGCQATGEAMVVDPNRDVSQYLAAAAAERMRLTHVAETHIHADFVSGARELAARSGAQLLLSDEGDADWKYLFAAQDRARLLKDGDMFMVGGTRIEVRHTPGHTSEHIIFLVTDTPVPNHPIGALTGDFVFVGDVGRPDLLERAANVSGSMKAAARKLFRSLQGFKRLPDHLQIWPGHGAGSACGKSLGAMPFSTLGYERIANWGLLATDEAEFVEAALSGQPDPPAYFAEMKRVNKAGPPMRGDIRQPPRWPVATLRAALGRGTPVVDLRPSVEFAQRHIPGTLSIPANKSFTNWAGWLLPYDRPLALIGSAAHLDEAIRDLVMIGLEDVAGVADVSVLEEWTESGHVPDALPQVSVGELAVRLHDGNATVVDVRSSDEWSAGHLPGAPNVPLGHLAEHVGEFAGRGRVYLYCQTGSRSSIGASVLAALGIPDVVNVEGGFAAWKAAGLPTTTAR